MEGDHEKLEETLRSEHEVSIASYVADAEILTEVTPRCFHLSTHLSWTVRMQLKS